MRALALLVIGAAGLAACASQQEQQQKKMASNLDPYVGQSIAAYVAVRGPPQAVIDTGPSKKMYQWLFTGQSAGATIPINGMMIAVPPKQLECRVTMTATTNRPTPTLADWTITTYQWAGDC